MAEIKVKLGHRSYPIVVGSNAQRQLGVELKKIAGKRRVFAICDAQVWALHGGELAKIISRLSGSSMLVIPGGEKAKSELQLRRIYDYLLSEKVSRGDLIVACGGGVTSDLVGFAAATALRGIKWAVIPTTLIGMVDAAIGGKTGINHRLGKNLIGAFWQPSLVWCDTRYLMTLSGRQMINGLGEVLKYAGLKGGQFLRSVEAYVKSEDWFDQSRLEQIIAECAGYKARIVAEDEKESGRRMVLNLGHTFAHAFEAGAGFGRLLHGEALIPGLKAACHLSSSEMKSVSASLTEYQRLVDMMIDLVPKRKLDAAKIMSALNLDKKRSGLRPKFILLKGPGSPIIAENIAPRKVRKSILHALDGFTLVGELSD